MISDTPRICTGCLKSNNTVKTDLKDTGKTSVILFISNQLNPHFCCTKIFWVACFLYKRHKTIDISRIAFLLLILYNMISNCWAQALTQRSGGAKMALVLFKF